jgi:hypothetical protein
MKKVILVAGGKSIREEWLNNGLFDNIRGHEIWSLNYAYRTMTYLPDRQLWVDKDGFFDIYKDQLFDMSKKGVKLITQRAGYIPLPDYTKYIYKVYHKVRKFEEQFQDESYIFTGKHGLVGLFALSLAVKEGYDEIFLLGMDFGTPTIADNDTHYYSKFIKHCSRGINDPKIYRYLNDEVNPRVKDFAEYKEVNSKIYNVSMISNIPYFEKITYERMYEIL